MGLEEKEVLAFHSYEFVKMFQKLCTTKKEVFDGVLSR